MNGLKEHLGDKLSIYILLAVIGSLLFYYYFTYVPGNRNSLNQHASQVLDDKATSIVEKYTGYNNAINSAPLSYLAKWYFKVNPDEESFHTANVRGERFYFSKNKVTGYKNITRNDFKDMARVDGALLPEKKGPELPYSEQMSVWKVKGGGYYFVLTPTADFYEVGLNIIEPSATKEVTLYKSDATGTTEQTKTTLKIDGLRKDTIQRYPFQWVSATSFTANLKDNDFFEDLFIVRANYKNTLANDTTEEKAGLNWHILDKSQTGLTRFHLPDSATRIGAGVYKQYIQGEWYHVYYKLVKLRRGLDVFVVGLVKSGKFETEAKSVPSWFVVFCSLAALFMVFMFPVLKLFLLNKHERLSASDINFSIFSIILCGSLLVILIIGAYFFWGSEKDRVDDKLKTLSDNMYKQVHQDISLLVSALDDNTLFPQNNPGSTTASPPANQVKMDFNEAFTVANDNGRIRKIIVNNNKPQPDVGRFPVSVAQRKYYSYFKKTEDDQWKAPYYLEAINSFASGKTEVAVSKPSPIGDDTRVITSPFYALSQGHAEAPFKFVVMTSNGDIKFHSDWTTLRSENFRKECQDSKELEAYLHGNIKGLIDFNYLRKDCRGYFRHLDKDWYLLVYYETANTRDLSAQVFMLCLIGLGAIIIYSSLLHFILRLDRIKLSLLKTSPFFYDWLNPKTTPKATWKFLVYINLLLFLAQSLAVLLDSSITLLAFTAFLITLSYLINYYFLKEYKVTTALKWLVGISIFWLIVFVFMALTESSTGLGLLILPAAVMIIVIIWKITTDAVPDYAEENSDFFTPRLFLYIWLLTIIIIPSFTFLIRHYNHELVLRNFSFIVEDEKWVDDQRIQGSKVHPVEYKYSDLNPGNVSKVNPDSLDFRYYAMFPRHTLLDMRGSVNSFGNIPEYEKYELSYNNAFIQVTNKGISQRVNSREIDKATFDKKSAVFFGFFLLGLLVLIWWTLAEVARRIFYLPNHKIWQRIKIPPADEKDMLKEDDPDNMWEAEQNIIELMEKNRTAYEAIWEACSDDEKLFLYDLAEDGVANQANKDVMISLYKRELISLHPLLKIRRVSFAHFVRLNMKEEKLKELEKMASKSGRWSNIRIMLIIVVLAMFGFLSVAEEGFLGRAAALLGSLVLILPNLLTVIGSIGNLLARKTYAPPAP